MAKNVQYAGVTLEVYNQLQDKLKLMGLSLKGNNGSINEKGVAASYNFNPEEETLQINDLSVDFPASMMLNSDSLVQRMTEMIQQYGGRVK